MDDSEVGVLSLAIVMNLIHIQKNKLLESPLEVTITDADDRIILDCEVWEGGKFRDVFGVGHLPLNFDEFRLPVTVMVTGNNGEQRIINITPDMVHEYLVNAKKFIQ